MVIRSQRPIYDRIVGKCSLHSWDHILVHPKKKSSKGCLRVRQDTNADADADANRSKTICRPPLKGVDIINDV